MKHGLIDQAEIDELPDDNVSAFIEFERICRERLEEILASLNGEHDDWGPPRIRYMAKVGAAAREYRISGWDNLPEPNPHNFQHEQYVVFDHDITQMVTRLQIQKAMQRNAESVSLPPSRAAQIEKYVEVLRRRIEQSDFDPKKKAALLKKLEALKAELTGKRADLSKTMLIIASIVTTINQTEQAVIKLPQAISAFMEVIGLVKQDEEAEKAAIAAAAAPKALEDKRPKPMQSRIPDSKSADIDDEIPF